MHASDISQEIQDLLSELNKRKIPLWQQMRVLEIISAVLADKIMSNGCTINLDPEEIIWSDGTISKPPAPEKGKRKRKKPDPMSKNGIYSVVVHSLGPKSKNPTLAAQNVVIVKPQDQLAAVATPQKKKTGAFPIFLQDFLFSFTCDKFTCDSTHSTFCSLGISGTR